jgi:hypothetical protein
MVSRLRKQARLFFKERSIDTLMAGNRIAPRFVHTLFAPRDWQDRPQFNQLCDWWRDVGTGVCALVGMGGAGKTAIVDRFLQALPDLFSPQRLLVFSFYDAPNPDEFFGEMVVWLAREQKPIYTPKTSYHQLLCLLEKAGPVLLVLDGLERVQSDGARGETFGQLLDRRLSDVSTG